MAKQTINIGSAANDGTGDGLRTSFTKVNANFTELYNFNTSLTIPTDVADLTDNSNLLGGGGGTGSSLVNGEYTVELNSSGNLTVPQRLIIGAPESPYESHLEIDASSYWTSIQWTHLPFAQDPAATPFECHAQLLRVFSGSGEVNGHEELVAVSVVKPTDTTHNGLMFTTSDGKIPDAPYNDGVGTMYNWVFGGDGTLSLPIGLKFKTVGMGWGGLTTNDQAVSILAQGTGDYAENTLGGITVGGNSGAGVVSLEANNFSADPAQFASWTFRPEGQITFPYLKGNARTGDGENLQFNRSSNQKIISTASGNVDFPGVERLVIAGGDSYYDGTGYPSGEAGDIYLWAGRGYNGGDIKVDAGNSLSAQEGGTIKIRAGSSDSGTGGFVEIWAGTGGDTNGQIRLYAGNNEWVINPDATLLMPPGADILNSNYESVIKSIPQNLQSSYDDYTLTLADGGKHIYKTDGDGYGVTIPTNASVAFTIGTAITIVSGSSECYFYLEDGDVTEVWGAGFNAYNQSWYIPPNSMATLLKLATDKWMLSGAGLASNL